MLKYQLLLPPGGGRGGGWRWLWGWRWRRWGWRLRGLRRRRRARRDQLRVHPEARRVPPHWLTLHQAPLRDPPSLCHSRAHAEDGMGNAGIQNSLPVRAPHDAVVHLPGNNDLYRHIQVTAFRGAKTPLNWSWLVRSLWLVDRYEVCKWTNWPMSKITF